jgi:mycothiol synthase
VSLTVVTPDQPEPDQVAAIRGLLETIAREDGRDPLSDQALTHISSGSVQHALALDADRLVGYAQLDGTSLEVAAESTAVPALLDAFAGRPVLVWSHGEHSRLAPVLAERGFTAERELHQLRRSLEAPIDTPPVPDGVELRAFAVGRDEDDWVRVNSAAFAHHPEQGSWTRGDLEAREHESWFDPSGFLMAWRDDTLLGFHWTKVHPDGAGEVYVIAVDPSGQGLGLGVVLLQHGLAYLLTRGCSEVLLYVDGSNTGAMRLYERNGFHRHDLDVQWRSAG